MREVHGGSSGSVQWSEKDNRKETIFKEANYQQKSTLDTHWIITTATITTTKYAVAREEELVVKEGVKHIESTNTPRFKEHTEEENQGDT